MDKNIEVYNKLVRDKILEILALKGLDYKARILENDEYADKLDEKLLEEIKEYLKSRAVEELADIQEVIFAILKNKGISREDFDKIRKEKLYKHSDDQCVCAPDEKLLEEIQKYLESGAVEELADIQEVIFAILKVKGVSRGDFDKIRKDKLNTRGGFEERIFLETVTSAK